MTQECQKDYNILKTFTMLKERQKSILEGVIQEYIRTAKPVASKNLTDHSRISVSPATVRSELSALDNLGYLEQPHTSAGRIPTDKGYRFFVDNLIHDVGLRTRERELLRELFNIEDEEEFVRSASKTVSRLSRTFVASGLLEEEVFFNAGFSEILEEPEFYQLESIRMFGRLVDQLEDEVRNFFEDFESENDRIFIGEENSLKEAHSLAIFISRWKHPRGFKGFTAIIGPKRTNYSKHKAILKEMASQKYGR